MITERVLRLISILRATPVQSARGRGCVVVRDQLDRDGVAVDPPGGAGLRPETIRHQHAYRLRECAALDRARRVGAIGDEINFAQLLRGEPQRTATRVNLQDDEIWPALNGLELTEGSCLAVFVRREDPAERLLASRGQRVLAPIRSGVRGCPSWPQAWRQA